MAGLVTQECLSKLRSAYDGQFIDLPPRCPRRWMRRLECWPCWQKPLRVTAVGRLFQTGSWGFCPAGRSRSGQTPRRQLTRMPPRRRWAWTAQPSPIFCDASHDGKGSVSNAAVGACELQRLRAPRGVSAGSRAVSRSVTRSVGRSMQAVGDGGDATRDVLNSICSFDGVPHGVDATHRAAPAGQLYGGTRRRVLAGSSAQWGRAPPQTPNAIPIINPLTLGTINLKGDRGQ